MFFGLRQWIICVLWMAESALKTNSNFSGLVSRHLIWFLLGLTLLLVLTVRLRLLGMPLERDEGEYAYAGQLILQGVPPYKEAYNMKLPGTYAAYAVIMAAFGQSAAGIHLGVLLINVTSIVLVFALGRMLLDDIAGLAAAVVFALLSLSPSVLGLAGHATHFVALFAIAGSALLGKGVLDWAKCISTETEDETRRFYTRGADSAFITCALAGIMFGLCVLMKQHGIFFSLFGFLYLAGALFVPQNEEERRKAKGRGSYCPPDCRTDGLGRRLLLLGTLILGMASPYILTVLSLWCAGVLPQFLFWTVSYARQYASAMSLFEGRDVFRASLGAVVGPNLLLWVLPCAGAVVMWWEHRWRVNSVAFKRAGTNPRWTLQASAIVYPRFFLSAFGVCSLGSVSVGMYFRGHYFITLLPAIALLSGVAVSRSVYLLKSQSGIEVLPALIVAALFILGIGAGLVGNGPVWFILDSRSASKAVYHTSMFCDAATLGWYLRTNSEPGARIAVIGSEPEICFYARRRSVSRYIYTYALMEPQPFARKMQEEMIAQVEGGHPEYVVYADDNFSWLTRPDSDRRILDWWDKYWPANLDLVKDVKIEEPSSEVEAFNRSSLPQVGGSKHLLLFKRHAP